MIVSQLLAVVGLFALSAYHWHRRRLYLLAWQLNGPTGYPLIGAAHLFFDATKVIDNINEMGANYGTMSKVWMGQQLMVQVDDPEQAKVILNSALCINKGASYKFIETFLGKGLVTLAGDAWRQHRKLLNPAFSSTVIIHFETIFNKHMHQMVTQLRQKCSDGEPINIFDPLKRLAMDIICETTMDREMNTQLGESSAYLHAIDNVSKIAGIRIFSPLLHLDLIYRMTKHHYSQEKYITMLQNVVQNIIGRKMDAINTGDPVKRLNSKKTHLFIDRVLRLVSEGHFSRNDAMDEANTVLLAGYETTATSLSFVMLMLAMHPECQERVFLECESVQFDDNGDIQLESLSLLTYLDMCIKETMRLFPSVPYLTRTTTDYIRVGGKLIPPGIEFVINCMRIHRSEKLYANPMRFDPDHFLPEAIAQRHPYGHLPFSAGARSCIGSRYASMVLKMTTVYVVRTFRLRTTLKIEDLKFRMNITLNMINPHWITLETRPGAEQVAAVSSDQRTTSEPVM